MIDNINSAEKGKFIAFEGIDGSGKSTQIKKLMSYLSEKNIKCCETREPTEGPVGSVVHQVMTGRLKADSRVIAALFAADRIDHLVNDVDGICKLTDKGITVLTDRYYFSSYAYHSVDMELEKVIEMNRISAETLRPTVNIFLDVPVKRALERIAQNRVSTELYEKEERLIKTRENYFKAFDKLKDSERIVIIDADADEDAVHSRILDAVSSIF